MMRVTGLVPARFLTIISHLIAVIIILFSGVSNAVQYEENVKSCIPDNYSTEEYDFKSTQLNAGLGVACGLFLFELISFMAGVSMFMHFQCLFSTCAHCGATIALSYFLFEAWPCDDYWYVFGFCSCLPTLTELMCVITVFRG